MSDPTIERFQYDTSEQNEPPTRTSEPHSAPVEQQTQPTSHQQQHPASSHPPVQQYQDDRGRGGYEPNHQNEPRQRSYAGEEDIATRFV